MLGTLNLAAAAGGRRGESGAPGGRREGIGLRCTFRSREEETNGRFEGRKDRVTDVEKEGGRGVEDGTGRILVWKVVLFLNSGEGMASGGC